MFSPGRRTPLGYGCRHPVSAAARSPPPRPPPALWLTATPRLLMSITRPVTLSLKTEVCFWYRDDFAFGMQFYPAVGVGGILNDAQKAFCSLLS